MEETIKIQEEFENLIEQLERLKNINDLTSSNAESSNKVILHIDSFIKSTNEYKKKIENDYLIKSEKIEKLLVAFDKSIIELETKTKELSGSVSKSFDGFKSVAQEGLGANTEETKKSAIIIKEFFELSLDKLKLAVGESLNANNEEIKNASLLFNTSIEVYKNEISGIIDKSNRLLIDGQNKNKIEVLENIKVAIKYIEQNDKQIKTLKTFLIIICGLIIVGIVATIIILK